MPRLDDADLANTLHQRRSEARFVENRPHPQTGYNCCHENALAYVLTTPGSTIIRGWLIEEFGGWNRFVAHSVVQTADGTLVDPTPTRARCEFIPHDGDEDDFASQARGRSFVPYPPLNLEDFLHQPPTEESDE
jgi:hypothetical protein